jgi:hypothetical protein
MGSSLRCVPGSWAGPEAYRTRCSTRPFATSRTDIHFIDEGTYVQEKTERELGAEWIGLDLHCQQGPQKVHAASQHGLMIEVYW